MNVDSMHFKESSIQQLYKAKGYVSVPFLNDIQISLLERIFHKNFNINELPPVYDTVASTPAETIRAVDDEIIKICLPILQQYLENFYWVCSIYFVKKSAEDSYTGMHLDPSMTMEGYNNVGVWIPLCDIDENNGRICLLSGSENILPPYSTPSMPYAYEHVEHLAEPKLDCLCMKAGNALFFNNSMLHCTQQNKSGTTRLAVIIKLIDANAPLATVYYNPNAEKGEQVSLYEHSKDVFVNGAFRSPTPPENSTFLKFIPELPHILSEDELINALKQEQTDKS